MNTILRGLWSNNWETRALWVLGLAFASLGLYQWFKDDDDKEKK